jgi:hypothetical protein
MVRTSSFTVNLVDATTKVVFKEHTKGRETYVEAEPDAEYFIHIEVPGSMDVLACVRVDGKSLGYMVEFGPGVRHTYDAGLVSYDGINVTTRSLKFAKAKLFNSENKDQNASFWTGKVEVDFHRRISTGRFNAPAIIENKWDGGDVGFVMGQADPKMKGVMTKQGSHATSEQYSVRAQEEFCDGGILQTITMNYCSTVGLMFNGVLGPINPMILARKANEQKRGADQVAADMASHVRPTKIRVLQEMNGRAFGIPKEFDLFDLTCEG